MYYSWPIELFYLFFQGALCLTVFVFVTLYLMTKKWNLLMYSVFLMLTATHFFINAPFTFFGIPEEEVWKTTWYDVLNIPVIIAMNFANLAFLKSFYTDLQPNNNLNHLFERASYLIGFVFILFVFFYLAGFNRDIVFFCISLMSVLPSIMVVGYVRKHGFQFSSYLSYGLVFYLSGTLLTLLMNVLRTVGVSGLFTEGYTLFFLRIGILGDMLFLLTAILQKWHWHEKQFGLEKIQTQLTIEKLRNKLSMELHDDLGASISGLNMYSHLALEQIRTRDFDAAARSVGVIQESAVHMVSKLSDLVWLIKPQKDSLEMLIKRLEDYACTMAAAKRILVRVQQNNNGGLVNLSFEQLRNIYLICVESINNAIKYSAGTLLHIDVSVQENLVQFTIEDNGMGFDPDTVKKGQGLNNLVNRSKELGADLCIRAAVNSGCIVSLSVST